MLVVVAVVVTETMELVDSDILVVVMVGTLSQLVPLLVLLKIQGQAVVGAALEHQVAVLVATERLALSLSDTLQHKAHQHHLAVQTHHRFYTVTAIKYTSSLVLEL
jgi:hypothetical protein